MRRGNAMTPADAQVAGAEALADLCGAMTDLTAVIGEVAAETRRLREEVAALRASVEEAAVLWRAGTGT